MQHILLRVPIFATLREQELADLARYLCTWHDVSRPVVTLSSPPSPLGHDCLRLGRGLGCGLDKQACHAAHALAYLPRALPARARACMRTSLGVAAARRVCGAGHGQAWRQSGVHMSASSAHAGSGVAGGVVGLE